MEQFIYRRAAIVAIISEWFRRTLLSKSVPSAKLRVIPNFVDTDYVHPAPRQNHFSDLHHLNEKFCVLYAGNIGLTQGFETILTVAKRLTYLQDMRFLIIGGGARFDWLKEQIITRGVDNVILLPYQPRPLVPEIYATGDVCLVPLKRAMAQDTFPSKVYSIMAAGRPAIVAADTDSELAWVVGQAGCGWAVPPEDEEALVTAILNAYHRPEECRTMGEAGRQYVIAHHSRQAVARQYNDLVTELVRSPQRQ